MQNTAVNGAREGLPAELVAYLNNECTHVFNSPVAAQNARDALDAQAAVKLGQSRLWVATIDGKFTSPEPSQHVSVEFIPKSPKAAAKMEGMRRLFHATGPNLTYHGERKIEFLEANGVSINKSMGNNKACDTAVSRPAVVAAARR